MSAWDVWASLVDDFTSWFSESIRDIFRFLW